MGNKGLLDFFYECGFLKNLSRSGWIFVGKDNPESVAEHCFRTAIVGYVIAKKENVDSADVLKRCLFHDIHETRTGDLNKVNKRYLDSKKDSFAEIIQGLPGGVKEELEKLNEDTGSREAIVSKDADLIECVLQAKEYIDEGYESAWLWINNTENELKTQTAIDMLEEIKQTDSKQWWKNIQHAKG